MLLSEVIQACRDRHPAFERTRVPNVTIARYLTAYQRELVSKALLKNRTFLAQEASIVFAISALNAVGTAGAGTTGGLPASVDADGIVSAVEAPVGSLVELAMDDATTAYAEKPVTSATSLTLTYAGAAWTVNEHATRTVVIVSGRGAGQRRTIASNTSTALTNSQAWTTTPDTTSVFVILVVDAESTQEMGVVAASPFTTERIGYLVKQTSAGVPYIDLSTPLTATLDSGITLPPHHFIIGGQVRFADDERCPLTLIDYAAKHQAREDYAAYVMGGQLFLVGNDADWENVLSIELRYVPIPPAFAAMTDVCLLPDTAFMVLVAGAAHIAALRVNGLPDVPKIDVGALLQEKGNAETQWLREVSVQRRARVSVIKEY